MNVSVKQFLSDAKSKLLPVYSSGNSLIASHGDVAIRWDTPWTLCKEPVCVPWEMLREQQELTHGYLVGVGDSEAAKQYPLPQEPKGEDHIVGAEHIWPYVKHSVSKDPGRFYLMGVRLENGDAVATDGYRLTWCRSVVPATVSPITIPTKAFQWAAKYKLFKLTTDGENIKFSSPESPVSVYAKGMERYVPWQRMLDEFEGCAASIIPCKEFIAALTALEDVAKQHAYKVTLDNTGTLTCKKQSSKIALREGYIDSELQRVSFNSRYMLDYLKICKAAYIALRQSKMKPWLLRIDASATPTYVLAGMFSK